MFDATKKAQMGDIYEAPVVNSFPGENQCRLERNNRASRRQFGSGIFIGKVVGFGDGRMCHDVGIVVVPDAN